MPLDDQIAYNEFDPANPYRDDQPPLPRPTSGMAVTSFVCGLFFFVPFITSTLAIVLGIVSLRNMRQYYVGGRIWAVWGITFGALGLALWLFVGGLVYVGFQMIFTEQAKAQVVATKFVQELSDGNLDAASKLVGSEVSRESLQSAADSMKPSGPFKELNAQLFPIQIAGTLEFRFELEGNAIFSKDNKPVRMSLSHEGDGAYKIDTFRFK